MAYRCKAMILAGSAAVALMAAGASASTVDLTYKGPSTAEPKTVEITNAPVTPAARHVYAFGFNMEAATDPLTEFLAWCLDIESYLGAKNQAKPYTITNDPFSNSDGLGSDQRARVQAVFDANFATLDASDGYEAAGFQLALWDALYDDDWAAGSGTFAATADSGGSILGLADDYLGNAANYMANNGPRLFNMTFWESTPGVNGIKHQNLVSVAPVPLPAAGWLMIAGVGGLAALRRRKAKAA